MKKKTRILIFVLLLLLISACGIKDEEKDLKTNDNKKVEEKYKTFKAHDKEYRYKIDAPYFGTIELGNTKIDMVSNYYTLKENEDIKKILTGLDTYKVKQSGDGFYLSEMSGTDKYEITFTTYTDIFEKNGLHMYTISKKIKLPKNITYESTVDDVIKAYGEPYRRIDCNDTGGICINHEDWDHVDGISLNYLYEKDDTTMDLKLHFSKEDNKLYYVNYRIIIPEA